MTDVDVAPEEASGKKGKKGVLIALLVALLAGGAGFALAFLGIFPAASDGADLKEETETPQIELSKNAYIALDPLVVNIRSSSKYELLRFAGQLEVKPEHVSDIEAIKPRLMDVMNTYLNALEAARFEDPVALIKLRAQILRRLQIISGPDRIEDLLIMEFILQ